MSLQKVINEFWDNQAQPALMRYIEIPAKSTAYDRLWESHGFGIHISIWPYIPSRRDNPDLPNYLGYANAKLYYRYKRHLAEIHISPIISDYTRYHGSVRLGYAFAINRFVSVYAQYFYGYADSLYEYNILTQRIGIGLRATSF